MSHPERLNAPEDGAKKLKKRIPSFLNRPRSLTQMKIASAVMAGGLVWGSLGGFVVYDNEIDNPKRNAAISKELEQYPKIPRDQIEIALKEIQTFEAKSKELGQQGEIDQIPEIFDSQHLKKSYELANVHSKRRGLESRIEPKLGMGFEAMFGIFSILGLGAFSLAGLELLGGEKFRSKRDALDAILSLRTDWKENPPRKEELINFCRGLSYLPPVGGKIPLVLKNDNANANIKFDPSLTAEQQVKRVTELRQKNELGDAYIHQVTVQGRLPDRFKYAAIALILNSPYGKDWTKPHFEAPWGKVAPLVHDGGKVQQNVSPVWHKVEGRTDFLERIANVHMANLEEMEQFTPEEKNKYPVDVLAEARAEQEERDRLGLEGRAYQRLALALHAQSGTAPKKIPEETQTKLAQEWMKFELGLSSLLREYGVGGVAEVQWFRDKPKDLDGWLGGRYEADWLPIQEQLIHVETVKKSNPEIRLETTRILSEASDRIDRIIGILPKDS